MRDADITYSEVSALRGEFVIEWLRVVTILCGTTVIDDPL